MTDWGPEQVHLSALMLHHPIIRGGSGNLCCGRLGRCRQIGTTTSVSASRCWRRDRAYPLALDINAADGIAAVSFAILHRGRPFSRPRAAANSRVAWYRVTPPDDE